MVVAKKKTFSIERRDARIIFPETSEYYGVELVTKLDVNVQTFLKFQGINDGASAEELAECFTMFGDTVLTSWNIEEDGELIPATGEGFMTLPPAFCMAIIGAWAEQATTSGKV